MRKYMLIYTTPEEYTIEDKNGVSEVKLDPQTKFFDDYRKAYNAWVDLTCGLGAYAELYARMKSDPEMEGDFVPYTYIQIE